MPNELTMVPSPQMALMKKGVIVDRPVQTAQEITTAKASKEFEAMFVGQMIKPMLETVDVDERFGGGKGEEMFRGLLTDEYGKKITAAGGIGLASQVQETLLKAQEQQNLPNDASNDAKGTTP